MDHSPYFGRLHERGNPMESAKESLCEYAIPGKEYRETYPFPYKCQVMYECRMKNPTKDCSCIRKEIAKNQLIQNGRVGIERKCQEWKR